jgi:hypothetical protein
VQSQIRLNSFCPSGLVIGIVSEFFDSIGFHTKRLNDLGELLYVLVGGAGRNGKRLVL